MENWTRLAAETAAQHLLLLYRAEHPAWTDDSTPVDDLVRWLGLEVATFHSTDYEEGTYGYLEPNEDLIWLCRDLPPSLRRFTLAHELGHAVLHRAPAQQSFALRSRLDALPVSVSVPPSALPLPPQTLFQEEIPTDSPEDHCQQPDVQEEISPFNDGDAMEEVLGIGQTYNPRSERELAANVFAAELLMPLTRVRTLYLEQQIAPSMLANRFEVSNAAMLNRLVGLVSQITETNNSSPETLVGATLVVARPHHAPSNNDTVETPPRKQYDEFQQAAIEAPTPALIVAGPGSGKTSTLIGRVDYLINTLHVPPEHILALTFSRKAAEEMQERLQAILRNGNNGNHTSGQAMPKVSTFHAFCADMLRLYGTIVGLRPDFALVDETEGYFLLRQLARNMRLYHYRNLKAPAYYFPDILKAISRAKDELVTPQQYRALAERMLENAQATGDEEAMGDAYKALEVAHIYAVYEEALQKRGDTDFGGLIMLAVQLLEEFPEICFEQQQKFHHILVDEFQDINRASGVLLQRLAGEARQVWVVGDANQAIYGFRGASPANIARFQQDYTNAIVLPLSRNYRSRPDIVQLSESFRWQQLELITEPDANISRADPGGRPGAGTGPVPGAVPGRLTHPEVYVTVAEASDNANELAGLVADIRARHALGYAYSDMAILSRTRARMEKITRALLEAGLPVVEKVSVLEQPHIKDLLSIVLLVADTHGGMGLLRAARQREHPLSQGDIEALLLETHGKQPHSLGLLVLRDETPPTMSIEGRRSLSRLSAILQSLFQHATNAWSLLAQYLFIETSLMRDLLTLIQDNGNKGQRHLLADYIDLLTLARRYDQQQKAAYTRLQTEAAGGEERGASPPPPLNLQEQARGFLDYLQVMVSLGQDSGNRAQAEAGSDNTDEQPDVLRIMTVHASKGLEFPIVYLPGLIQSNFPMRRHGNPVPAPAGMVPAESEEQDTHDTGEACLFYVGVTRARDQLVLSYSRYNGKQKAKRSAYLDALLTGLPPERIARLEWQGLATSPAGSEDTEDIEATVVMTPSGGPSQKFIEKMKPNKLISTDIETYQRCPRSYLYGTIYGFRGEQGAYLLFWQATQKTLESLQQRRAEVNNIIDKGEAQKQSTAQWPTLEEARDLYTQHWQALGGQDQPFAAIYERHGHEVTELLHRKLRESGNARWELRPGYTVEVAGRTIHVPIDRVEAGGEGGGVAEGKGKGKEDKPVKFVRTHFNKSKKTPDAGIRELLYTHASRQHATPQKVELLFHNLSTGEVVPLKLSSRKEQSLFDALVQSLQGLERDEYPPHFDARTCPGCPFYFICPV